MRNSLLTVCSLIITFVIGEICIRIIYGNPLIFVDPQVKFIFTDYGYKFKPNQKGAYVYDKPANINSFGFRDYEWVMPKPDGRIRIMCLGDSITFGNAVNVEDSYPKVLEKKLKRFCLNCEVISAAVGGWDTYEEAGFFNQEGIKYQPDILILGFYINDFTMRHKKMISIEGRVDARPRWLQWLPYKYIYLFKRSALVTFLRLRIFNIIAGNKDFGTSLLRNEVDLDNDSRIKQTYSYILEIKQSCDENKVKLFLISIPPINFFWLPEGSIQYPGHLKNFCKSHNIIYFDISDHFAKEKYPNTLYLYPWDYHLSPKGHASIAEYLAVELEK